MNYLDSDVFDISAKNTRVRVLKTNIFWSILQNLQLFALFAVSHKIMFYQK